MAETSLHSPDEVYGEYATANGFDVSNEGTEAPLTDTLPDPAVDVAVEVLLVVTEAAVDARVLSGVVG